jgi:hypothetical protein
MTFSQVRENSPESIHYSNQTVLATSQLGFRPESPKTLTLIPGTDLKKFPDQIPFYIQRIGSHLKREMNIPETWSDKIYRWPYDMGKGKFVADESGYKSNPFVYKGFMKKTETRWGIFWQADFSDFKTKGNYQIECEFAATTPFMISADPYSRLIRSYLLYQFCQRSGFEVPGVRPVENADDGILDTDKSIVPAMGGWNDAGDYRKWISQTVSHMEALSLIVQYANQAFKKQALEEIAWGNKFLQAMISPEGMVYEDLGAGPLRHGMKYEESWWCENHAGCIAAGSDRTDNIPGTGDERTIRTTYNPVCQFLFIRNQAIISRVLPPADANKCFLLAEKAWKYGEAHPHDQRTLFVSEELLAALDLYASGSKLVNQDRLRELVKSVLNRQGKSNTGLSGYFLEKDGTDGYRSIVWSAEPAMALLHFCELNLPGLQEEKVLCEKAVREYIENYLIKDAASNPFGVTPYGIYTHEIRPEAETFRSAGSGFFVRTFIHPYNSQEMPHGGNSVLMHHAYLMARAAKQFGKPEYASHAEKLIQWATGHNTVGLCLFTGVGFRHPVQASFVNYQIPEATVNGFLGRPDDTPYLETSNLVEWCTQEVWGVPFYYTIGAITYLELK